MFLIPGLSAFFTFVYLRPQEVFELMRPVSLAMMVAIVGFGYVLDMRLGVVRLVPSPLMTILLVLLGFCLLTIGVKASDRLADQSVLLLPSLVAFWFVSQGLQGLRAVGIAAAVLVALTLVLALVGIHQGLSQPVCYLVGGTSETPTVETLDGRPCTLADQCVEGGLPGREYFCEHPGLFDTHSIAKRVRFRGLLEDPNELSWAISMSLPLAFALYERRRTALRFVTLLGMLVAGTACVVMTQSRSGVLSLAAVLGAYFVRRFGWRLGAVAAVITALPVVLLGGRSGEEAESSSEERLECWSEALSLWRENPLLGVGQGQFTEHHYLTAHNSVMLTLAELGPFGLMLWTAAIYFAFKITIRIQTDFADRPEALPARTWAAALTASLVGMSISAFLLSIAYHTILWAFLGLVGGLYASVRVHAPSWRLQFGWRDIVLVVGIDTALVSLIAVYLRLKGI